MSKTLSAVILNYNYSKFLETCLDSVINQTQKFDEIFVVDDYSNDNSLEILEKYADKIKVIKNKKNMGLFASSQIGIENTKSDYIYILDSDDWVSDTLVEETKPLMKNNPVKIQFQLIGANSEKSINGSVFPKFSSNYNSEKMLIDNQHIGFYLSPPTSGNIYKASFLKSIKGEFYEGDAVDGMPALYAPYKGNIEVIARPLGFYRIHENNFSCVSKINKEVFEKEINRFWKRWENIKKIDPSIEIPKPDCLYVSERILLISTLKKVFIFKENLVYLSSLKNSNLPLSQKAILSIWSIGLNAPSKKIRDYLIKIRRNGTSRPRLLKSL